MLKLLSAIFLINVASACSALSCPPMNSDRAKNILLRHLPSIVIASNAKLEWEKTVNERSLVEVDEAFIPGQTVIRIREKTACQWDFEANTYTVLKVVISLT